MIEMKTPLRTVNKYDVAHFTTEAVQRMIKDKCLFVTLGGNHDSARGVPLESVVGLVTGIKKLKRKVYVEWKVLDTPLGKGINENFDMVARPIGLGIIDKNVDGETEVRQDQYKLLYFALDAAA